MSEEEYDYIFIDCPPSLGLLTLNCLCAADSFLVPLQCEYYALEGLSQLMTTVRMVKKSMNPSLALEGVLPTMFDGRTNLSIQVVEEVKKHFPWRGILVGCAALRAPERSAQPRQADHGLRPDVPRRGSISFPRG